MLLPTKNTSTKKERKYLMLFINLVFASDLKWKPQGNQADLFKDEPIHPVFGDILITKLRPGQVSDSNPTLKLFQTIELEARAEKGIGHTHSKWSPVATATYRLMPGTYCSVSFNLFQRLLSPSPYLMKKLKLWWIFVQWEFLILKNLQMEVAI
jgi:hypothetical protein